MVWCEKAHISLSNLSGCKSSPSTGVSTPLTRKNGTQLVGLSGSNSVAGCGRLEGREFASDPRHRFPDDRLVIVRAPGEVNGDNGTFVASVPPRRQQPSAASFCLRVGSTRFSSIPSCTGSG